MHKLTSCFPADLCMCYTHRCWGIRGEIPDGKGGKRCLNHHSMPSSGLKNNSIMNSIAQGKRSSVSVEETIQHSLAGWPSTLLLLFRGKQGGSRSSKKPAHVGPVIGMPIARRIDTPTSAI